MQHIENLQDKSHQSPSTSLQNSQLNHMSQYRPLPQDILNMSEMDTACQYCGISYLLLSKYENMEKHIQKVDIEMAQLKKYIQERPQLLAQLESLAAHNTRLDQAHKDSECRLTECQIKLQKEEYKSQELLQKTQELRHQLEHAREATKQAESNIELQASTMTRNIINLRYNVIRAQSDLAKLKGYISSSIISVVAEAKLTAHKQIIEQITKSQQQAIESAVKQSEQKSCTIISSLRKETQAQKQLLKDSQKQNQGIVAELGLIKKEYSAYIDGQRTYTQDLQSNHLALEKRLHYANRDVLDITAEREKIYAKNQTIQTKLDTIQQSHEALCDDYNRKILDLQTQLSREQLAYSKKIVQLEETVKELEEQHFSKNDPAQNRLHKAMAKKDEQIMIMEKTVRELNTNISAMRSERVQTIEAHQSRIKQLQEKFLEDIKHAGEKKTSDKEIEIRRICSEEKIEALCQQRKSMHQEFEIERQDLNNQIDSLKNVANSVNLATLNHMESTYKQKIASLTDQMMQKEARYTSDCEKYHSQVDALEKMLSATKIALEEQSMGTEQERISQLKKTISVKDSEIKFLKDTVRLECEERMGLVSMVARLKLEMHNSPNTMCKLTNVTKPSEESHSYNQSIQIKDESTYTRSRPGSAAGPKHLTQSKPSSKSTPSHKNVQMDNGKSLGTQSKSQLPDGNQPMRGVLEFERLMHAAAVKKNQKMAKLAAARI
ncbi:hypothetical protein QVD99_005552 [Batrachochytrium dendrobatidis]|nr:hypothetical protein QVD99_005552 [Batrachochytrium dendrobatidis]